MCKTSLLFPVGILKCKSPAKLMCEKIFNGVLEHNFLLELLKRTSNFFSVESAFLVNFN